MLIAVIICLLLFAVYASLFIGSGVYVKAFCRGKGNGKIIALTFDDGPDPVWTPKVLEVLKRYNVKATFFCIGQKVELYPKLVEQLLGDGHLIGNHTFYHKSWFPLLSKSKMVAELQRFDEAVVNISGQKVSLFRPPFGVTNPTIAAAVISLGYRVVGWSIRSFDTVKSERSTVLRRIIRKCHCGGVILLHDNIAQCDWLVEQVIVHLLSEGYEIKRLDELFEK